MRKAVLLMMMLCFANLLWAQVSVTGRVTDDKNEPVPNATITVKGTALRAKANDNGLYAIRVNRGAVLVITAIGMTTREITVGDNNTIDIVMRIEAAELMNVVVNTGVGIKRSTRETGYSTTRVKPDLLTNGRSPSAVQSLSGKASGLVITNADNSVRPATRIVLRGNRSITGNNQALVVLDGVPVPQGTLDFINPNDIADITLLKGANAAAIYGSEGVNGVVVVTTKKGSKGKTQVTFTHSTNFDQVSFLPKFQNRFGQGTGADNGYTPYENQSYGPEFDGQPRQVGRTLPDGSVQILDYKARPAEKRKVWDLGITAINDIALSGGDEKGTFYVSFQDQLTNGIVPKDRYRRSGMRFSSSRDFGKFKAQFDLNYVMDKQDRSNSGQTPFSENGAAQGFYWMVINTAANIPLSEYRDWKSNPFANPNGYFNDYYNNPWFVLDNERTIVKNTLFTGNFQVTYQPLKWLSFLGRIGADYNNNTFKNTVGKFVYSNWAKSQALAEDGSQGINRAVSKPINGGVGDGSGFTSRINTDFFATITRDFGDISAKLILGNNVQVRTTKNIALNSNAVVIPDLYNVTNRTGELLGGENNTEIRRAGNYADLTLGYKDYLFVHGAMRYDQSSLFFLDNRRNKQYSYLYGGGDVAVILTNAFPGLVNKTLSYAKLRASFNHTGNENIGAYGLEPIYTLGPGFPYGSLAGASVGNVIPDPSLRPEFVDSYEAGIELGFFKNRLLFDVSAYKHISRGQIIAIALSNATAYTNATINAGQMDNYGFDVEMKAIPIRKKNFTWELVGNYAYNDNEVKSLYKDLKQVALTVGGDAQVYGILGSAYPYLQGTAWNRDPQGRVIVNPVTGYPERAASIQPFGRTIPRHVLGLGTTLRFKNWSFSMNTEYRGGFVVYHQIGNALTFTGVAKVTEKYGRQRFVFPNSSYWDGSKYVPNTSITVADGGYPFWDNVYKNIAENYITPGDFWKIRDASLTWQMPAALVSKVKFLKGGSLTFFGRNLITLVAENNWYTDPEFSFNTGNGQGINTIQQTPPVRSFGASLQVIF